MESGTFKIYRTECNLTGLICGIVNRFATEHPNISISGQLAPGIIGAWDSASIAQLVTELISNAIKYGNGQPIEIEASQSALGALVTVRDRGLGISAERLDRIFERRERSDPDSRKPGLGVGLWMAKQIAEAHGGTLLIRSEPGQGSTFVVELPFSK